MHSGTPSIIWHYTYQIVIRAFDIQLAEDEVPDEGAEQEHDERDDKVEPNVVPTIGRGFHPRRRSAVASNVYGLYRPIA